MHREARESAETMQVIGEQAERRTVPTPRAPPKIRRPDGDGPWKLCHASVTARSVMGTRYFMCSQGRKASSRMANENSRLPGWILRKYRMQTSAAAKMAIPAGKSG